MHGNDPATWAAFFTAVTGAAAALVGLLFVAVSINLDKILKNAMLPARAAETLAVLLFVVVSSALALVPQDVELLGAEILVIAVPLTAITVRSQLKFQRQNPDSPLLWSVSRATTSGVALFPGHDRWHLPDRALGWRPLLARAHRPAGHRRRRLQHLGPSGGDRSLTGRT